MSQWCKGTFKLSNLEKETEKQYVYEESQELLKSKMEQLVFNFEEETQVTERRNLGSTNKSLCAPSELQAILAVLPRAGLGISPGLSGTSLF